MIIDTNTIQYHQLAIYAISNVNICRTAAEGLESINTAVKKLQNKK